MNHSDAIAAVCTTLADERGDLGAAARLRARSLLPLATEHEVDVIARAAVAHTSGLGPLEDFLHDPSVSEIIVNNGGHVWVERNGTISPAGCLTADMTPRLLERMLHPLGRRLDRLSPIVDARLPDGSRLCAVIPPVAPDGACFTLRRFGIRRRPLSEFAAASVLPLLRHIVDGHCNVVISGATSSGKTSLLNALAGCFAANERIITLEDTAELALQAAHVLRLETRPPTADGVPAITMTDLVRTSLRLRPDRLVLGEVRGAEAIDLIQAMNTGHDGSFTTCHANNPHDALRRLEALLLQHAPGWPVAAIREHLRSAIDIVIHVERSEHGRRQVTHILQLAPPGAQVGDSELLRDGQAIAQLTRTRSS